MKSNKNIEDKEINRPNIIKGFDLLGKLSSSLLLWIDFRFVLLMRLEKGLFTTEFYNGC